MKPKLVKKQKYIRKTAKHSARRPKLKDAEVVRNNKETGEEGRPKHAWLKPTNAKPTPHKAKLTT